MVPKLSIVKKKRVDTQCDPILKIYFTFRGKSKSFSQLKGQTRTLLLESFREKKGLCSDITRAKRAFLCVYVCVSKSNDIAILVALLYVEQFFY